MATESVGIYRFRFLAPGVYTLKVSAQGFATQTASSVELAVSRTTTVNFTLKVGSVSETVTVYDTQVPLVDLAKTSVGMSIRQVDLESMPLNGRDFGNLAWLAPGTKAVPSYDATKNHYASYAVNSSVGRDVNVTVNGIDDKDNTVGGPVMQLPLSAIREFEISTARFSAANGRSQGAAVNVATKTGANAFHGGAYFYGTGTSLNANDYFSKKNGSPTPKFQRQQFGGDFGGPIRKDKDFFYVAIERDREQLEVAENATAYKELSLLGPALGNKVVSVVSTPYFDTRFYGRLDHEINGKNSVFVSYTGQNNVAQNDGNSGLGDTFRFGNTTNDLILTNVSWNSVLSPRMMNVVTVGYQYWHNLITPDTFSKYVLSFPGGINYGTYGATPQENIQKKWQFKDDIATMRSNHSLSMGFDFVWEPTLAIIIGSPVGLLNMTLDDLPSVILGNTNGKYPQGLSTPGTITAMTQSVGDPRSEVPGGVKMFGAYFQDDWKVRKGLTLNLGVRYDIDIGFYGAKVATLNRTYQMLKAIDSPYAAALPHDDKKNIGPRVGIAWDIHGTGNHVLRAGYGIYYDQMFFASTSSYIRQTRPVLYAGVTSLSYPGRGSPASSCTAPSCIVPGTNILLSEWRLGIDPLPMVPPPLTQLLTGSSGSLLDPNFRNPYSQEWNLGYSWMLNTVSAIEAEYVHLLALHQNRPQEINPLIPGAGGARYLDGAFRAAGLPVLASINAPMSIGRSRYDGLNLTFRRRMKGRFSVNATYTLSRAVGWGAVLPYLNTVDPFNPFNPKTDFGPLQNDERHHVSIASVIRLPRGFQIAPVLMYGSPKPWTAQAGQDVLGYGRGMTLSSNAVVPVNDPTNFMALATNTPAQLRACLAAGTCQMVGFNAMRGSPIFNVDLRATKEIKFGDKYKLTLNFQCFNLTNRANFGQNYFTSVRTGAAFATPSGFLGFGAGANAAFPKSFRAEFGAEFRF
jgi:hypothetical protein